MDEGAQPQRLGVRLVRRVPARQRRSALVRAPGLDEEPVPQVGAIGVVFAVEQAQGGVRVAPPVGDQRAQPGVAIRRVEHGGFVGQARGARGIATGVQFQARLQTERPRLDLEGEGCPQAGVVPETAQPVPGLAPPPLAPRRADVVEAAGHLPRHERDEPLQLPDVRRRDDARRGCGRCLGRRRDHPADVAHPILGVGEIRRHDGWIGPELVAYRRR